MSSHSRAMNQKYGDYQIPPKADDDDKISTEEYWKELLNQAENDHELKYLLQSQNSGLMKELLRQKSFSSDSSHIINKSRQSSPNQKLSLSRRASSNNFGDEVIREIDSNPIHSTFDASTLEYVTSKYKYEYTKLKEKYSSALDLAFFFSNMVHQQKLVSDQLKRNFAQRELEHTTLKQNIEALSSALKRTQN